MRLSTGDETIQVLRFSLQKKITSRTPFYKINKSHDATRIDLCSSSDEKRMATVAQK
jgi:hypothetical protein